jgi:uncharacterized protein YecE (DUF72 family)
VASGERPAPQAGATTAPATPALPHSHTPVFCGVAGWSYPDWDGYVYTPDIKDKLRFVAGFVDVIEINNTFYRPPDARTVASWVQRTEDLPGFFFAAKLHQDVTHRGLIEPATVAAFRDGLRPLAQRNRLRHLLAQFKWDFADTPATRAHLTAIKRSFGDITNLTFELRHNSWQAEDALGFLAALEVSVANLDYPTARNSFNLRVCAIGEHAYFRLHGRNAKAWFSKGAGRDETYNYLYSDRELDDIVRRAGEIGKLSKTLTLVANNHYQGKEAVNILQIKSRLTGSKVPVPPQLLAKYPELERIRG